ncbi:hypothetical protein COV49_01320 [Candidatus Falkowbacteria bacterium CG11_big_fil_rev_8_21_14_0_20_39_10]|uniref:MalT-like TPR region domain-containing protein n=1 Tax=Candidatus Falkowbacteria bacterium CG11_big_fil_rev_8_21_14_0_20_39_10 TaxID=1974570 RepID=A0A2M6K9S1_9BACT|nr:MAG: hypothetical protein COV49_01320 [Candidatus Falkowbacteria bacterium CG11_big_fil_rev_8_21_14_0_20_39_10]
MEFDAKVIVSEAERLIKNYGKKSANPAEVEDLNKEGITSLMAGGEGNKEALKFFLQALEKSGGNRELRAQCFVNLGDFLRRVVGAPKEALHMFCQAEDLTRSLATKARIKAMEAMVYMLKTHLGQNDLEGVQKNIAALKEAIKLARLARQEDLEKAKKTEGLAFHRLIGTVCHWGNDEQKVRAVFEIDRFLTRLDPDSPEIPQMKYSRAMILMAKEPEVSGPIFLENALYWEKEPTNACGQFVLAADCYVRLSRKTLAKTCLAKAEEIMSAGFSHTNVGFEVKIYERVKAALGKS